jgi:two-component system nitrogen regulation sensor histidine kinase NtrY
MTARNAPPPGTRSPGRLPRWWRRTVIGARKANLFLLLELLAISALVIMVISGWYAFSSQPSDGALLPPGQTTSLLVGTLIPALALLILLGRRLALKRSEGTGGKLHVRLVFFFSLVAAVPTLIVAVFASFLFQTGVEFWFSDSSRGIVENANRLAEGYYEQNQRDVQDETLTMASDLRFYLAEESIISPDFAGAYAYQVAGRRLNESAILQAQDDGSLSVAAIVDPEENEERQRVDQQTLERLMAGEPIVVKATIDRIEAVTPIDREAGIYLYAARNSDTLAFSQWETARSVIEAYDVLTERARVLQLRYNLALFFTSLFLVGLAVWFALRFADRQVRPLTDLVSAARSVGSGNYALRVAGRTGADEIGLLNRAFNRMTAQIERQTGELRSANSQLDERRAFIEAVLESISAGIISLDARGDVQLMNSSAQDLLLGSEGPPPVGVQLTEIAPDLAEMIEAGLASGLVQYSRHGELLTLAVKVAGDGSGHVITFEDITRQLLDQRQAAWSDVARRIAHEIKNPLTPIQLATERLKRRYGRQIEQDVDLFDELTGTIIRQVGDLRKMVDEFSSFARLPKPVFRNEDAIDLVRQALFLQEVARGDIDFGFHTQMESAPIACDRHQFGQAMTNVLKNASEAIDSKAKDAEPDYRGRITVEVERRGDDVIVRVTDNGIGLPKDRERIVEPYVTTREKGTGLGLPIVNKIVEEHGGEMTFAAADGGGTQVTMRFARDPSDRQGGRNAPAGQEAAE